MFDIPLLIAVIVALVEVVKKTKVIDKEYSPLVSLALGLVIGIFYVKGSLAEQVMYGLIMGLSASGLFDQSKIVKKGGNK